MICEITSSLQTFKTIRFHCGLNILLADSLQPENAGATRNSSGKTSLIEIVHFLLGANIEEDSIFKLAELAGVTFFGTFFLRGELWRIARETVNASRIVVLEGNLERYGIKLKTDRKTEAQYLPLTTWKDLLGHCYFGLPFPTSGSLFEESYAPSFRSLIGFFARRELEGGFEHASQFYSAQQDLEAALSLSFLLGLDWQLPQAFLTLRERRRNLDRLEKATKNELFAAVLGRAAELRPQLISARRRAEKLREEVANFRVLAAYEELSSRASRAKSELQRLSRRFTVLQETIEGLRSALEGEKPPAKSEIETMFAAVGVQLPSVSMRRFDEVAKFHESVVANRRTYLAREVDRVGAELDKTRTAMEAMGAERAGVLRALDGAGALEDFKELQRQHAEAESRAAMLQEQLRIAEQIETEKTQIEIDILQLQQRLQQDLHDRHEILEEAQRLLLEFSSQLYNDRDASLQVEATRNGPSIQLHIPGDRGGGVHSVEIFLLDLVLFQLCSARLGTGRFLIHDSHLFDGVDERQVARCLLLGRDASWTFHGQYIVTMNSDVFSKLPESLWPEKDRYVVATRITDEPTGGLFGLRFSQ